MDLGIAGKNALVCSPQAGYFTVRKFLISGGAYRGTC
jgi:hypothetical protein